MGACFGCAGRINSAQHKQDLLTMRTKAGSNSEPAFLLVQQSGRALCPTYAYFVLQLIGLAHMLQVTHLLSLPVNLDTRTN